MIYCNICGKEEMQHHDNGKVTSAIRKTAANILASTIICSICCYLLTSKPTRRGDWWGMTKEGLAELLSHTGMTRTK